jgi:hypothetical protein
LADRAKREFDFGGTGRPTPAGRGHVFDTWQREAEQWSARTKALRGFQEEAKVYYSAILDLPTNSSLDPKAKRRVVSESLNALVSIAQNPLVQQVLGEDPGGRQVIERIKMLRVPEIIDSPQISESVIARDRFTSGILLARDAIREVWEIRDNREIGALEALFLAAVIDLLIVILGFMRSEHVLQASTMKLVDVVANIEPVVRWGNAVGLGVTRNDNGEAENVDRNQELALQALNNLKLIKVVQVDPGGSGYGKKEIHVLDPILVEPVLAASANL